MFELSNTEKIKIAVRQIQRWGYAAKQDADPLVAALHADYMAGNLDLLRQMYSDMEVEKATGINALQLWKQATEIQDLARSRIEILE